MDTRAQAAHIMARIAEVQLSSAPAAAPSNYDQLVSVVELKKNIVRISAKRTKINTPKIVTLLNLKTPLQRNK